MKALLKQMLDDGTEGLFFFAMGLVAGIFLTACFIMLITTKGC